MKLLKIDHKLTALHLNTSKTFNITDNLNGQVIRQIIYNGIRFCILTTTQLHYLYKDPDYKLVDVTQNVGHTTPVHNIKFITNTDSSVLYPGHFNIITNSNEGYICKIKNHTFKSTEYIRQLTTKDITTVPSEWFGYIYKEGNKYVVEECSQKYSTINRLYTIDELPTNFMLPNRIVYNGRLMEYKYRLGCLQVMYTNVSHMYNYKYYCTNNGRICYVTPGGVVKDTKYDIHKVSHHIVIDYNDYYLIILNKQINKLEYHTNNTTIQRRIDNSHYHTENLLQYINYNWNIRWTINNHHTFDKYTDKFVKVILKCCRYSVYRKYIPRGVLFMIIQFAI